ncbi:unnamed protein product [Rotaria socialis]|uniref:Squalene synthase n=2 Tax=Rotaria socialis TaxID=392032 RepID=A0A820PUK1_9BILA|nr:unnamed protein product [Rotaria socialis]CAF3465325.1 unnamed protein product [Rotaria socialis]CAF3722104.1 unnamed protein product [Rotaria socialis]CAF4410673.1 unnamed protein product [Rotaria socialis]CAF4649232.1 unnamed protein product [Rotaria socialis]
MNNENSYYYFHSHSLTMIILVATLINVILYIPYYFYQCLLSALATVSVGDIYTVQNDDDIILEKQQQMKAMKQKWFYMPPVLKELTSSFLFPTEIIAILKLKFGGYVKTSKNSLDQLAHTLNDLDFCYATLNKVSRSFALVIQQLPQPLKDSVCIFYLVLRGLDSVEDDMTYPQDKKIFLLHTFYSNLLIDNWSIKDVGDTEDYRILLDNFGKVINVFKLLDKNDQSIISNITLQMGTGMAEYVGKIDSIETLTSYNLYCHYVAGLVGHGLSALFVNSGLEDTDLCVHKHLSNSMGLFLQKTNIIRDYLEDLKAGRTWWPKEIWQNYAAYLDEFAKTPNCEKSLECLNHMVLDSFNHVPDVINYLSRLKHRKVLEFCAIPQVMAMATLVELYNNPSVFTSVVKIRKGLTCKLMLNCSTLNEVLHWIYFFITKIEQKIPKQPSVNAHRMQEVVDQVKNLCDVNSKI